jgi:hypothetical protein
MSTVPVTGAAALNTTLEPLPNVTVEPVEAVKVPPLVNVHLGVIEAVVTLNKS